MIIGIGSDIVRINRIEKILEKYNGAFKVKILHQTELDLLFLLPKSKHAGFLAKRFAAKEAISKAFGTGIGKSIGFKDIKILNDSLGKPYVVLNNNIYIQNVKIDITMSDDYPIAIAFALVSLDN